MKKSAAMKLLNDAYAEYEEHREEFHAFCADAKSARIIREYELLKSQVTRSADHVKSVYRANHAEIGTVYKDFSVSYATELDAEALLQELGDDAEIYIDYVPRINREAYDTGVRNGNISAETARAVERPQPRLKAPKF